MKKKIIFGVLALALMAINVSQSIQSGQSGFDLSQLVNIASATPENGMANKCCPIWDVSVTTSFPWPTVTCTTGGQYKCEDCTCPTS